MTAMMSFHAEVLPSSECTCSL